MVSHPSQSGIVTDEISGERHIPESTRADGSTRKAIRIRPGYRPPEDVEVYKNRPSQARRRIGIPGTERETPATSIDNTSSAASKNAKRRKARKCAKAAANKDANEDAGIEQVLGGDADANGGGDDIQDCQDVLEEVDPQIEQEKKAKTLRKKLRQAKELQKKEACGQTLLPEQIAKVIKITELVRELEALGLDPHDGEPTQHIPDPPLEETNGQRSCP